MLPSYLNQSSYTSCIKIFGVPIIPPLITEERRKELNDDKQRAVEIEKRLKGKRSSVDSGVMTGSYTEHLRNSESQQSSELPLCLNQASIHDLNVKENVQNGFPLSSCEAADYAIGDSFLKTALEDPEFREFFSSTAEKIFKDNKIENLLSGPNGGDYDFELKNVSSKESEIQLSEVSSESSGFVKPAESLQLSHSENVTQVPSVILSDMSLKCSENTVNPGSRSDDKQTENEPSSPPPPRIRRNSYTLASPSPVLLEHMAKEIASNKEESDNWKTLPDKKEKAKGPGFKTFSGRNQRKHWNKKTCNSSNLIMGNHGTKHTLGRSNTFVKLDSKVKVGESNYSLPCSSRTSPLQFCPFTHSVDCIKSIGTNPLLDMNKDGRGDFRGISSFLNKVSVSQNPCRSIIDSETETLTIQKDIELDYASVETSPNSLINNPSSRVHSNCDTDNSSPPQIEFSDSASQMSVATQSKYVQQNTIYSVSLDSRSVSHNLGGSEDFDDIASLCSTMSISKFLPPHDISRPSTAEDLSEASIHKLKMKHEDELRNLLEKQRQEEEIYTQLLSSSGSLSSRTTTNISLSDLFEFKSEQLHTENRSSSCSRQLFPFQKPVAATIDTKQQVNCTDREMEAATKLTAYAKGYLTRRLLTTKKVQQLIELIKESLTCAFSLQLEPHLKPTDLELHAHLAKQMNTALKEFQTIISAPVAARMAIIAADRERLRKPASRPSSTISTATRKSILRRQQSLNSAEKKSGEGRARTKSLSVNGNSGSVTSGSYLKSDSGSTASSGHQYSRQPWR